MERIARAVQGLTARGSRRGEAVQNLSSNVPSQSKPQQTGFLQHHSGLFLLQTTRPYSSLKERFIHEQVLEQRYRTIIARRAADAVVGHQRSAGSTSLSREDRTTLKAQLFMEFRQARIATYDCLTIASHNATLIRNSYTQRSEAATEPSQSPASIEKCRRFIDAWRDFFADEGRLELITRAFFLLTPGGGTEQCRFPCANVTHVISGSSDSTTYMPMFCGRHRTGSRKSLDDPDLGTERISQLSTLRVLVRKRCAVK